LGSQTGDANKGQSTYNPAMLKRIYIDNFRCFVNFEYKPERKQLLLGANGSGKSSLLDAIRAVQGFVCEDGLDHFAQSTFKNGKTPWLNLPRQVFEIEAELEGRQYVYRLEIQGETVPFAKVLLESLKVDGNPVIEHSEGAALLFPDDPSSPEIRLGRDNSQSSILGSLRGFRKEAKTFVDWLSSDLICLIINPFAMRGIGKITGRLRPAIDMNDIADWYMSQTSNDIEGVFQLRASLQEAINGLASLNFKQLQPLGSGDLTISFNRIDGYPSYRLMELSEGQRCLVALYMILHFLIAKGKTVFLDEPDNFLSLREIQPWLLAAEDAVEESKGQLILISHHPEILNYWAREYGLLFSREENGHTRIKPYREVADTGLDPAETIARGWEQ